MDRRAIKAEFEKYAAIDKFSSDRIGEAIEIARRTGWKEFLRRRLRIIIASEHL